MFAMVEVGFPRRPARMSPRIGFRCPGRAGSFLRLCGALRPSPRGPGNPPSFIPLVERFAHDARRRFRLRGAPGLPRYSVLLRWLRARRHVRSSADVTVVSPSMISVPFLTATLAAGSVPCGVGPWSRYPGLLSSAFPTLKLGGPWADSHPWFACAPVSWFGRWPIPLFSNFSVISVFSLDIAWLTPAACL